mgnify:CR=1 FL=1
MSQLSILPEGCKSSNFKRGSPRQRPPILFVPTKSSAPKILSVKIKINEVFADLKNASCSLTEEISARSFINKKGELTDIMSKSIAEATGRNEKPQLATDGGTSDARFIKNYCETAELGIRNQTLHQIDEFVYLKDLEDLEKLYLKIKFNSCDFFKFSSKQVFKMVSFFHSTDPVCKFILPAK